MIHSGRSGQKSDRSMGKSLFHSQKTSELREKPISEFPALVVLQLPQVQYGEIPKFLILVKKLIFLKTTSL